MNVKDVINTDILYYPTIEFQDETWLKSALCIWEKVFRIVPSSYTPKDSDEVKMAVDAGLVENITLSEEDLSETAEDFNKFWEAIEIIPAGIEGWESVDIKLHPDKVDARLLPIFKSLETKIDPDGFLNLSSEVASSYMLFLSESLSRRRNIPKITDNADMFTLMHYFTNDGNIGEWVYDEEAEEATIAFILQQVLPGGLEYMSIDHVIKFRLNYIEGRQELRQTVVDLLEEFTQIEDKNYAKEKMKSFCEKYLKKQRNLSSIIKNLFGGVAYNTLTIGVPASITAIKLFGGGANPFNIIELLPGAWLTAVAALADKALSRRKKWKQSDASYYYDLHRIFKSDKELELRVTDYTYTMNEFIND